MKKFLFILTAMCFSVSVVHAQGDFFRFDNNMMGSNNWYRNNMNHEINSVINEMNRNNWSNPYDTSYNNPVSKIFKRRGNSYSGNPVKDSDIEYLLTRMERNSFGRTYDSLGIEDRLDRLEAQMFGAVQSGDFKSRLNRLKHAYSAESTRDYKVKGKKLSRFKEFFSSGYPTSIPADEDYYSSLNRGFSAW